MRSDFLKEVSNLHFQENLTISTLNDLLINIAYSKYNEEYTQTGILDIWLLDDNKHIRIEDFGTKENILMWISNNKTYHDYQDLKGVCEDYENSIFQ